MKISVIITTFNEAEHIGAALQSVAWADEKLVIDSFSTDQTSEIAQKMGAAVLHRKYSGPADQKNWAIPKASHDWVLILDADERVTPELADEIKAVLEKNPSEDAFWIRRQSWFMGRKIRYSGWQNDKVLRLVRRDRCRYDDKQVHEEIESSGLKVGQLSAKMEHFTFKNLQHFIDKTQRYARWSAIDHASKTKKVTYFHLFLKPLFRFFQHFILKKGFLDGKSGFLISVFAAWGVFLRYAYLLEQKKD